jgi:hypothetical protein
MTKPVLAVRWTNRELPTKPLDHDGPCLIVDTDTGEVTIWDWDWAPDLLSIALVEAALIELGADLSWCQPETTYRDLERALALAVADAEMTA